MGKIQVADVMFMVRRIYHDLLILCNMRIAQDRRHVTAGQTVCGCVATTRVKQQLLKAKGRGRGHFVSSTKSDRARTLTVAPVVPDILRRVKAEQVKNHLAVGPAWENEHNFVFTNAMGHFIVPETAYKTVKRTAAKIGRADLRFHSLRHSYAVNALQAGDDLKTVSQSLGHATASFTADVYGHVSERMRQESAERMQNFYESLGVKKG